MYVQYNDGAYQRPIIKQKELGLLPYMVMANSTGNGQNQYKNPFKLENTGYIPTSKSKANKKTTPEFIKGMFSTNQQQFQHTKIAYKSSRANVCPI